MPSYALLAAHGTHGTQHQLLCTKFVFSTKHHNTTENQTKPSKQPQKYLTTFLPLPRAVLTLALTTHM